MKTERLEIRVSRALMGAIKHRASDEGVTVAKLTRDALFQATLRNPNIRETDADALMAESLSRHLEAMKGLEFGHDADGQLMVVGVKPEAGAVS